MNILITCAGRRSYIVEYFREVVGTWGGRVVTANSEYFASGLLAGDRRYVVPRIDDPHYIPRLLEITRTERVGLVLSLFDIDLPLLAAARDRFHEIGAEVAVSDPDVIEIANDKWRMSGFFREHGIATPRTWLDPADAEAAVADGEARMPLFVKPRWGMGSIGMLRVRDTAVLRAACALVQEEISRSYLSMMAPDRMDDAVIIQEAATGQEYGADVFNDLKGAHVATVVKRKLAMRAGETDVAATVDAPEIAALCMTLATLLRHRGNLDADIMLPKDGPPQVLEINARFGGGYPFSHLAGARFPRALVQMAMGEVPDFGHVRIGAHGLKDITLRALEAADPEMVSSRFDEK